MLPWVVIRRFLPYVLGVIGISAIVFIIDQRAVERTTQKFEKMMEKEEKRLREANRIALKKANEVEQKLRDELDDRNDEIQKIIQEAQSSDDAGNIAISPNSVQRINRVR